MLGTAGLTASGMFSDSSLQSYLSEGLSTIGIGTDLLNVQSVESLDESDDVRFLQLGGTFGTGFGIATGLIQRAFGSDTSAGPFSSISESFKVRSALYQGLVSDMHDSQWALKQTDYDKSKTLYEELRTFLNPPSDPIVVAVLDTGVDLDHPDLKDVLLPGYDATNSASGAQDENGHGTHCAGIIGAQKKSAESPLGVATMAGIKILPVKVLGDKDQAGFSQLKKAFFGQLKMAPTSFR